MIWLPAYEKVLIWNRIQKRILLRPPKRLLLEGDFGTGKSLILHAFIQMCIYEDPHNFIMPLLHDGGDKQPVLRTVLDVANRMRYAKMKNVQSIALADMLNPPVSRNPFRFIRDITEKYKNANIAVDEVNLQDLQQLKGPIFHKDFCGSLWIAISSLSNYEFKEQNKPNTKLELPEIWLQSFTKPRLMKNLQNHLKSRARPQVFIVTLRHS